MTREQIIEQINTIIKQNSITIVDSNEIDAQIRKEANRIVFFGLIDRKRITVKFCANKSAADVKNIINEASVLNFLAGKKCNFQSKIFSYESGKHPWIIKGYLGGKPAGKLLDFNNEFVGHISPIKVIDTIKRYKQYQPKLIWDYNDLVLVYKQNLDFINQYFPENFEGRRKWLEYFRQSIMPKKFKKYLSHNDLNAGNVLYDRSGNFRIIDWENAGFDTYQKDFANIYHMAYKYPKWQDRFIEKMNLTDEERLEFGAWAIYLLLFNSAGLKKVKLKNEKEYFRSRDLTNREIDTYITRSLKRIRSFSQYFI